MQTPEEKVKEKMIDERRKEDEVSLYGLRREKRCQPAT